MTAGYSLRSRVPGQSVMTAVVERQRQVPPRSRLARVFGSTPLPPDNRAPFRSALGEVLVGESLDRLGPGWDVLHAVPVDASNYEIDHLAIGPAGVFTVLTKSFPGQDIVVAAGKLVAPGTADDHVAIARTEASVVADLLSSAARRRIPVEALIVIVGAKRLTVGEQPEGVTVLSSVQLERSIARLPRTLDGGQVAYASDVADRESTWEATPAPGQDTAALAQTFATLRAEVTSARRVRVAWVGGTAGLAVIALWATGMLALAAAFGH